MSRSTILIADDSEIVRTAVKFFLKGQRGIRIVGEAASGMEAVQRTLALRPDVVVLDLHLSDIDGLEVARHIRTMAPQTQLIALTVNNSPHMVAEALGVGIRGYVFKSHLAEDLVPAIDAVTHDRRFLPSFGVTARRIGDGEA
jgi:DNA-binding NarL/FixJ family response regulator